MPEPLNIPYENSWEENQKPFSKHHKKVFSQHYQDGIIERIFEVIGVKNKFYVEFGARDGVGLSNTANLRVNCGWSGILFEPFEKANKEINLYRKTVTPQNVNTLFQEYNVPHEFDFLSIDVDGYDYWIWKALMHEPRLVQIEANLKFKPSVSQVRKYDKDNNYPEAEGGGASVSALKKLGEFKGYSLVYRQRHDLFFVKRDLLNEKDIDIPLDIIYPERYESWLATKPSYFIDV